MLRNHLNLMIIATFEREIEFTPSYAISDHKLSALTSMIFYLEINLFVTTHFT